MLVDVILEYLPHPGLWLFRRWLWHELFNLIVLCRELASRGRGPPIKLPWHWLLRTALNAEHFVSRPPFVQRTPPNVSDSDHSSGCGNEKLGRSHVETEEYTGIPLVFELAWVELGFGGS